ncbi:PucR family transcriptional regulator [Streptomyces toyocaensis]|uniref:PucR family transcriptional regulator n=1 Tax=Streptomyces toyocaensis TaxID=55952 RepID=A0A081XMZ8_STRTO|nr:helix-turn-helix domain-containing protein [Streptomyces toyocaensis]KES04921.1 PucR family transcriptional regulator [Streptomyces toyocaensis]
MNAHAHGGLVRVLHHLGATLLEVVHGGARDTAAIGGVVIHDPVDDSAPPPHALVLGVGLRDPDDVARLLGELGRRQTVALVVRAPVPEDARVAAAVEASGVGLLALTRGASWVQVAAMLRAVLAEGDIGGDGPETLGSTLSGDLFALANSIAALIDAPVTIEDRHSRVLAFSGQQDRADASRAETILGRQVPERLWRQLTTRGIFRDLYRSDGLVHIPPLPDGMDGTTVPRVAVAVRAGDEVVGSIWAAVREPLSPGRSQALRDSAKIVALHMLRLRAGADVERRLRADLVSTALEGGAGAREALNRLGLSGGPVVVLALALCDDTGEKPVTGAEAELATERARLADAFAMHLAAVHPHCAAALLGDTAYGLVPAQQDGGTGEERAVRIAADFLDRVVTRTAAVIGVGPTGADAVGLAHARSGADRALRVLRARASERRVARLADVQVEALLCDLRDLVAARGDEPGDLIARLAAYDERRRANLVETLRAWLDAFGDITAAAAAVHVHPNTFRYRLRRLTEVGGIDLEDPEARFAAMLQLRLLPLSRTSP